MNRPSNPSAGAQNSDPSRQMQDSGRPEAPEMHFHGPQNAEHELRKAYNTLIEVELAYTWDRSSQAQINHQEVADIYKHAFNCHRKGDRLAAERWARTAKHLSRALWSEAKIAFLQNRTNLFPFLEGATADEYNLKERVDTTQDLLNSVAMHIPPGLEKMPEQMTQMLSKGKLHLQKLESRDLKHELLRAEHIKAAHEYGRVLECMALAFEAEAQGTSKTQAA